MSYQFFDVCFFPVTFPHLTAMLKKKKNNLVHNRLNLVKIGKQTYRETLGNRLSEVSFHYVVMIFYLKSTKKKNIAQYERQQHM